MKPYPVLPQDAAMREAPPTPRRPMNQPPVDSSQAGFSLLEILIASFILAIGFLGMGLLQLAALQGSNEAYLRSQAAALALELSERMHANPTGASSGTTTGFSGYDLTQRTVAPQTYDAIDCTVNMEDIDGTGFPSALCSDETSSTGVDLAADTTCTPLQIAEFDAFQLWCHSYGWGNAAGGSGETLPGLDVSTTCNATPCIIGTTHTITVSWRKPEWNTVASNAACPAGKECVTLNVVP
ncbi:MAG: type IV pilus modification protein PilV [Magnetococcales bacterium]|nr:type IV pilus modification protein PilV [Magnetococcales bacterium]